jgi:hypothetical protein
MTEMMRAHVRGQDAEPRAGRLKLLARDQEPSARMLDVPGRDRAGGRG